MTKKKRRRKNDYEFVFIYSTHPYSYLFNSYLNFESRNQYAYVRYVYVHNEMKIILMFVYN